MADARLSSKPRSLLESVPNKWILPWVILFSVSINFLLLMLPFYSTEVFDRVLNSGSVETLVGLTVLAIGAFIFSAIFDVIRSRLLSRFAISFERHVAPLVLEATISSPAARAFGGTHDMVRVRELRTFLSSSTVPTLVDAPFLPAFVLLLWLIHPFYGYLALTGAVILFLLSAASRYIATRESQQVSAYGQKCQSTLDSIVRHANLIRAMGWTKGSVREFMWLNDRALFPVARANERVQILSAIGRSIRLSLQVGAVGAGAYLVLKNEVLPGSLMASSILIARTLAPMEALLSALRSVSSAIEAWKRVNAATDDLRHRPKLTSLPPPSGAIDVNHVFYFGSDSKEPILANINFSLQPGSVLAIVGPTGSGKSTLIRLIAGLTVPSRGLIKIDGSSIAHWDPDQLGQYVGYLPQEVDLLGGTVAEAISGFSNDACDEEIVHAATTADAHKMIQSLSHGYQTEIGRDGARLSGGQRQRVGLARAFFGNRKIILLDEPNSNLDPEGEDALCRAISNVKALGATVIIVTHRPRILSTVDHVLVLRNGMQASFGHPRDVGMAAQPKAPVAVRKGQDDGANNVQPLVGTGR